MVANGNDLNQENGSKNKRKSCGDPPLVEGDDPPLVEGDDPDCPICESCLAGDPLPDAELEEQQEVYDKEELKTDEPEDTDWSDSTEGKLEELVMSNLDLVYMSMIRRIASEGFSEVSVMNAMLRSVHCHGCNDKAPDIREKTMEFLRSEPEADPSIKEDLFEELRCLEKRVLDYMITMVKAARPSFSTGDALWCLLISDLNLSRACAVDGGSVNGPGDSDVPGGAAVSNISTSPAGPEANILESGKPSESLRPPSSRPEMPPNLQSWLSAVTCDMNPGVANPRKEHQVSLSENVVPAASSGNISPSSMLKQQLGRGRRGRGGGYKREYIVQQKTITIHSEKSYRGKGPKPFMTTVHKLSNLGGLVLDKKFKTVTQSSSVNLKPTPLKSSVGMGTIGGDLTRTISSSAQPSSSSRSSTHTPPPANTELRLPPSSNSCTCAGHVKIRGSTSTSPPANTELTLPLPSNSNTAVYPVKIRSSMSTLPPIDTELSLPLPSNGSTGAGLKHNCKTAALSSNCSDYAAIESDNVLRQWVLEDKKGEGLSKLESRVLELQAQLQQWTEWAQKKVMQAAHRLRNDKAELHTLRQEKEEKARLRKEEQDLEESTLKTISGMVEALSNANSQIEKANAAAPKLEIEKFQLRQEMEVEKLRAEEEAVRCQESLIGETVTIKKLQTWESEKAMIQEELVTEQHKRSHLKHQFKQAKEHHDHLEAMWRQVEEVKEEALTQAKMERKERERNEVSAKLEEDEIRAKAESYMQRYREDISSLQHQIAELKLTMGTLKIATQKWGLCSNGQFRSELLDPEESGNGDVQRDRECVVCLTEEICVLFLPCAHQVVCKNCNRMHGKQGIEDCPSCRTPIQRRICVRFANS